MSAPSSNLSIDTARAPLDETHKFFLANVGYRMTAPQIKAWFEQHFGAVNYVNLVSNRGNDNNKNTSGGAGNDAQQQPHKGYGFMFMMDHEGATAVEKYVNAFPNNKITMMGRKDVYVARHDERRAAASRTPNQGQIQNLNAGTANSAVGAPGADYSTYSQGQYAAQQPYAHQPPPAQPSYGAQPQPGATAYALYPSQVPVTVAGTYAVPNGSNGYVPQNQPPSLTAVDTPTAQHPQYAYHSQQPYSNQSTAAGAQFAQPAQPAGYPTPAMTPTGYAQPPPPSMASMTQSQQPAVPYGQQPPHPPPQQPAGSSYAQPTPHALPIPGQPPYARHHQTQQHPQPPQYQPQPQQPQHPPHHPYQPPINNAHQTQQPQQPQQRLSYQNGMVVPNDTQYPSNYNQVQGLNATLMPHQPHNQQLPTMQQPPPMQTYPVGGGGSPMMQNGMNGPPPPPSGHPNGNPNGINVSSTRHGYNNDYRVQRGKLNGSNIGHGVTVKGTNYGNAPNGQMGSMNGMGGRGPPPPPPLPHRPYGGAPSRGGGGMNGVIPGSNNMMMGNMPSSGGRGFGRGGGGVGGRGGRGGGGGRGGKGGRGNRENRRDRPY
mmetsp:Transcript_521/g.1027  ORF Transcript_521/g.1027 Transcript_521/m.1027 type:complete len:598 (+) Transcript_521:76-1869(+)